MKTGPSTLISKSNTMKESSKFLKKVVSGRKGQLGDMWWGDDRQFVKEVDNLAGLIISVVWVHVPTPSLCIEGESGENKDRPTSTVGGLETETLCKKESKKKTYLFNSRLWLGTWLLLGGSTMPLKKLFQPLRHANFGLCFYKMHHRKKCRTLKACQTKSICAGTMKLGQNLC